MTITAKNWGVFSGGRPVHLFTICNASGASVSVTDFGGIVTSILVPDQSGQLRDVVLGYDSVEEYERDGAFIGAMIGRYANRIEGAAFALNGTVWKLTANENGNTLHGGSGWHKKLWDSTVTANGLLLQYHSAHAEDGFPGNMRVELLYTLSDDNTFTIDVTAVSDRDTVCCITNHSYFNLAGSGDILSHRFKVSADAYTPFLPNMIPTGRLASVENTEFDFRDFSTLFSPSFDANFAIRPDHTVCASARDLISGIQLDVLSDLPALQFYNGYALSTRTGKNNASYGPCSGFCLEPQFFPNSPNMPQFPTSVLKAGDVYHHALTYRFSVCQTR